MVALVLFLLEDLERITIHVTHLFLNAASEKKIKSLQFGLLSYWMVEEKQKQTNNNSKNML